MTLTPDKAREFLGDVDVDATLKTLLNIAVSASMPPEKTTEWCRALEHSAKALRLIADIRASQTSGDS